MPNQWVKVVVGSPGTPNLGRVCPVKHGRPVEKRGRTTWTADMKTGLAYTLIDPARFMVLGPLHTDGARCVVAAAHAELLGPDECARLDAEHGMDGTEGEG